MEEKYIACMILHAVGDTVGYKNGEWEFKRGGLEVANEKLYEFINLGGVNGISLKNWIVSDDTIFHIKTAESLLETFPDFNKYGEKLVKLLIDAYDQFYKEKLNYRNPGETSLKAIQQFKKGNKWDTTPYDLFTGGSGAAMRTCCIGLAFNGEDNRYKLMQMAIENSRLTHNSAVGYLGGLVSALFVAFAIENINVNEWAFLMMDMFESGKIEKYIIKAGRDIEYFKRDSQIFINKWKRYMEDKFDDNKQIIKRKSSINLVFRSQYYQETFGFKFDNINYFGKINPKSDINPIVRKFKRVRDINEKQDILVKKFIGSGGDDSVIIAYDCLLDSGDNWEKLCVYSMMHIGDTDTTGCIAASWYGAMYGMKNVPNNFIENLEYKNEIINLAKKIFKKYKK